MCLYVTQLRNGVAGIWTHISLTQNSIPITLGAKSDKAVASSIDSKTHISFPPWNQVSSYNRGHFTIVGLVAVWHCCHCLKPLGKTLNKVPASELAEWVSTWNKISGTLVDHSFKKCYVSYALDAPEDDSVWKTQTSMTLSWKEAPRSQILNAKMLKDNLTNLFCLYFPFYTGTIVIYDKNLRLNKSKRALSIHIK